MPVTMVRNQMAGPTVFVDPERNIQIEWDGIGDPAGNDIQPVPDSVLEHPQFMRCQRRGIYQVVTDEEAEASLDRQVNDWEARQKRDANAGQEVIEHAQANDIVLKRCAGPAGRGQCPEQVQQKVRDGDTEPPLCQKHRGLKDQYVPMPHPDGVVGENGKVMTVWIRPTADTR